MNVAHLNPHVCRQAGGGCRCIGGFRAAFGFWSAGSCALLCQCSYPFILGAKGGVYYIIYNPGCPHWRLPGRGMVLGTCPSSHPLKLWHLAQGSEVFWRQQESQWEVRQHQASHCSSPASAPVLPGASSLLDWGNQAPALMVQSSFISRAVW